MQRIENGAAVGSFAVALQSIASTRSVSRRKGQPLKTCNCVDVLRAGGGIGQTAIAGECRCSVRFVAQPRDQTGNQATRAWRQALSVFFISLRARASRG